MTLALKPWNGNGRVSFERRLVTPPDSDIKYDVRVATVTDGREFLSQVWRDRGVTQPVTARAVAQVPRVLSEDGKAVVFFTTEQPKQSQSKAAVPTFFVGIMPRSTKGSKKKSSSIRINEPVDSDGIVQSLLQAFEAGVVELQKIAGRCGTSSSDSKALIGVLIDPAIRNILMYGTGVAAGRGLLFLRSALQHLGLMGAAAITVADYSGWWNIGIRSLLQSVLTSASETAGSALSVMAAKALDVYTVSAPAIQTAMTTGLAVARGGLIDLIRQFPILVDLGREFSALDTALQGTNALSGVGFGLLNGMGSAIQMSAVVLMFAVMGGVITYRIYGVLMSARQNLSEMKAAITELFYGDPNSAEASTFRSRVSAAVDSFVTQSRNNMGRSLANIALSVAELMAMNYLRGQLAIFTAAVTQATALTAEFLAVQAGNAAATTAAAAASTWGNYLISKTVWIAGWADPIASAGSAAYSATYGASMAAGTIAFPMITTILYALGYIAFGLFAGYAAYLLVKTAWNSTSLVAGFFGNLNAAVRETVPAMWERARSMSLADATNVIFRTCCMVFKTPIDFIASVLLVFAKWAKAPVSAIRFLVARIIAGGGALKDALSAAMRLPWSTVTRLGSLAGRTIHNVLSIELDSLPQSDLEDMNAMLPEPPAMADHASADDDESEENLVPNPLADDTHGAAAGTVRVRVEHAGIAAFMAHLIGIQRAAETGVAERDEQPDGPVIALIEQPPAAANENPEAPVVVRRRRRNYADQEILAEKRKFQEREYRKTQRSPEDDSTSRDESASSGNDIIALGLLSSRGERSAKRQRTSPSQAMIACASCSGPANFVCGSCRTTHYCSKACQTNHWMNHQCS